MTSILTILYALAFSLLGRESSTCQTGAIYFYEDASYVVESSDNSIVCAIHGTPEHDISFVAVSYNEDTGVVVATRFSYVVGSVVEIEVLSVENSR